MNNDLSAWIEEHAISAPQKVAIKYETSRISYRSLSDSIERTARYLEKSCGIGRGDRVAYLGFNRPECLIVFFACASIGAIYLPLNWRLAPPELQYIFVDSAPSVLMCDSIHHDIGASLIPFTPSSKLLDIEALKSLLEVPTPSAEDSNESNWDFPVLLVYTSGTTGRPKGVVLTQKALYFNALNSVDMHGLNKNDHILTVLPLFHVGGLNIQTTPGFFVGATVSLHARFDPTETLSSIALEKPTLLVLVPSMMFALNQHSSWSPATLSSLRVVTTGSTIVPPGLITTWHEAGIPIIQVYGSTETGPVALYQREEDALMSVGSTGRDALHTDLRIVDEQGHDVKSEASGELLLRGPNLFQKYWNDEASTQDVFEDGWFRTGDIGYRDERGFVFINDRKKDVVISGGENIYPAELEKVLLRVPGIIEAAVVGIPDERWGDIPVAVVIVDRETGPGTVEIFTAFIGQLARFKHPKAVGFAKTLPHNAMGKVLKHELRVAIEEGSIPLTFKDSVSAL